jgi:hypothetical protein
MMSENPVRLLLGPQRPTRNIAESISAAGLPDGTVATISAGWQEAEDDIEDLKEIVARPLLDLRLYARAEEVFNADEELAAAYRARQNRLQEQQRLYRLRLKQLAIAARQTIRADGDPVMVAAEKRHAIAQLRALDRHHLHRTESIRRPFHEQFNVNSHPMLAQHHKEIGQIIDTCSAVLITGGNVAVLLNRILLFGVDELIANRHIVAWSAGAMVLTERIVLFHDRSPQGRRDAEVFGAGCGLIPGCIFLPDAAHRLRESEHARIELMCRRFSPETCVALDNGAALELADTRVARADAVRRLNRDGRIVKLRAA